MTSLNDQIPENFLAYLTQSLGWTDSQIKTNIAEWKATRQALLAPLTGKWIGPNTSGQLSIVSFPEEESLETLRIQTDKGRVGTRLIQYFDSNSGKPSTEDILPADARPGVLFTEQGSFLFDNALKQSPYLPEVEAFIDWAQSDLRTQHTDIYPLPKEKLAFVSQREAGEVFAVSMATHDIVGHWKLRQKPSSHAFNFACDVNGQTLYISDSVSSHLHMIDLTDLSYRVYKSGLGILGSLAAAPVENKLYITILQPEFNVVYFNMETTQAEYSLDIRGRSWTQTQQFPHDSFHTLEGGNLIYITAHDQRPLLHLVDGEEIHVKRRVALQQSHPPTVMAHPHSNPYPKALAYDFTAHLVQTGVLSATQKQGFEDWLAAQEAARKQKEAEAREAEAKAAQEAEDKVLRRPRKQPKTNPNFRVHQPPQQDEALWRLVDKPASEMEIPEGAEQAITDLIVWAFYRMTLTNLRIHTKELQRVKKIARQVKEALKSKQVVLAKIDNILERHRFETPIDRNSVFKVIAQQKLQGDFYRLEDLCPLCQTPFEEQLCPSCHFQLSLPDHETLAGKAFSAEASDFLFPGQLLLPLAQHKSLMNLNIWRQPIQQVNEKGNLLKSIVDALVLPHHNFLVVDQAGGKLVEMSSSGEIVWKARLALKNPSRATFYTHAQEGLRYIVLDQGNLRILELDPSGRHHRRYPTTRTPDALKLKHPTDIQQVPNGDWWITDPGAQRVLRINPRGECIVELTEPLRSPLMARQNHQGNLEVLDTALNAWLLFNPEHEEIGRFTFWPPPLVEEERWLNAPPPHWGSRLHNGEWLLMGESYFMHMAPEEGLIRWIAELPNPAAEHHLLKVKFHTKSQTELQQERITRYAEALANIYGLHQVPEEKRLHLARHLKAMPAKKGQVLLAPGSTGHVMYFLLSGSVDCIAPEPEKPVIFEVGAGEIAGAASVLDVEKRTYKPGWVVTEDADLLFIDRGEFKRAVMGFSALFQLVKQVHQDQQRRIRQFQERKTEALQDHLRSRIAESLIKDFPIFKSADKAFFEALTDVLQANAYMPDHAVFKRNESSGSMFFIFEGTVGVLRKGESTPEITLKAGEFFGEMALLDQQPRTTTVVTLDYCKMFELQSWQAQRLFQGYPWFKTALSDEADRRQAANAAWVKKFARAAGVDRDDLPQVHVHPKNFFPEEPPRYTCSVQHDVVFALNPQGEVLWHWGQSPNEQLFHPHQIKLLEQSLLVVDTGNDRVIEISLANRQILRQWNKDLKQPVSADLTPEGFLLVANAGAQELRVSDNFGRNLWTYAAPREIENPCDVKLTPQGTILFTDKALHTVYELQRNGERIWSHGSYKNPGDSELQLNAPSFALRLEDGSTLIGDAGNQRLVRVLQDEEIQLIPLPLLEEPLAFEHVEMLPQGDLILYSFSQDRILRLGGAGPVKKILWQAAHQFPLRVAEAPPVIESKEPHWILDLDLLQEETHIAPPAETSTPQEPPEEAAEASLAIAEQLSSGEHWSGATAEETQAPLAEPTQAPRLRDDDEKAFEALEEALEATQSFEEKTETQPWEDLAFLETDSPPSPAPTEENPWEDLAFLSDEAIDLANTLIFEKKPEPRPAEPPPWGDLSFLEEPES